MNAIIWSKYGPPEVLHFGEVKKPIPKENEVLIRIHAATVTAGDCEMRSLKSRFIISIMLRLFVGIFRPRRIRVLGQELSGVVEEVGSGVTKFKPGDEIIASTGFGMGAYAEYISLPENAGDSDGLIIAKPQNISFGEAASIPTGGIEALHFLRKAAVKGGEKVLINGSGGSIGTIAVQLAKYYEAEVTAVDSGEKLEMLRSIGADHVIDYAREDFTLRGETYDVIFDIVGKASYKRCIDSLAEGGRLLLSNPQFLQMIRREWTLGKGNKRVIAGTSTRDPGDLAFLAKLVETGIIKPVVDRSYPLEQTAEAHRYVESGKKQGSVVITVAERV